MTDRTLVAAERSTPETRRAFLLRHMQAIIEREQSLARARAASRDVELSMERLTTMTATMKEQPRANAAPRDTAAQVSAIELQQQWTSARTQAEAYILMARRRAEVTRRVIAFVREHAPAEQRAILDELDSGAEKAITDLDRTRAELPAQPW